MRLFVAVPLPLPTQALLRRFTTDIASRYPEFRWTNPSHLHITLKFLGEVDDVTADAARTALGSVSPCPPVALQFGKLIRLGSPDRQVMALELKGDVDQLADYQANLDAAFARLGFEKENRKFLPHVTIGRSKRDAPKVPVARQTDLGPKGWFTVSAIHLMKSTLGEPEPVYETLLRIPMLNRVDL
ncbi:MAG TPA: RNA 2',3'-cyclic phosphodiesterase [Tepidisphaeraceae bacterium]|jgi:2'-5' RNA ligase|nr:RNA 2',3'-cyclic phosphodiesterase [Tepidisphaeraceae bacterium]